MPQTTPDARPEADVTPEELPPIPLVELREPGTGTVSFRLSFSAGSAQDPEGKAGAALLTAWLMAEGGSHELPSAQLKEKLFPLAAEIAFTVDKDQTVFYGRVKKDDAEAYYELLREVLLRPAMAPADFERIRAQILDSLVSGLKGSNDENLGKAALDLALYGEHPYGHPVLGIRGDLEKLSLEDVRDFRERHMCRHRLIIGLAGEVQDELVAKVRGDMEQLTREQCEPVPPLPALSPVHGRRVLIVDKPEAPATAISIGFPLEVRRGHSDYPALKLVEAYFGQHRAFMGRLQKRLRVERGLNYGNYAYVEHFEQEGRDRIPAVNVSRRQQNFTIWLRPVQDSDRHFAVRLALYELGQLVDKGLTQEQLEATRTFIKGYYPGFAQTQARRLGYAIDDLFYAPPGEHPGEYFSTLLSAIDKLTIDEVNAAIRKHLQTANLHIALVGKDAKALANSLASDAPSSISYKSPKPDEITAEDALVEKLPLGIAQEAIAIVPVASIFE
jgi:zinc protease